MPRKLPWEQGTTTSLSPKRQSATRQSATRQSATPSSPVKRRKRAEKPASGISFDKKAESSEREANEQQEPLSSPPPDRPVEKFMVEGLENDDKYRMVEDEFLSIAKQFTVHLHTAEYKRQEKMVKSRNAQTITTISRPVVGKMPNHTKQKVQRIELAKTQRIAVAGILGKKAENADMSDDSDGDVLPYIGTTLHGLMDKPRKRAASLTKVTSAATATRSANGFSEPTGLSKNVLYESPRSRSKATHMNTPEYHVSTASEGEDDLDVPISAHRHVQPTVWKSTPRPATATDTKISRTVVSSSSLEPADSMLRSNKQERSLPQKTKGAIDRTASISPVPRLSRLEQARRLKARQELQKKETKNLDVIPSFL